MGEDEMERGCPARKFGPEIYLVFVIFFRSSVFWTRFAPGSCSIPAREPNGGEGRVRLKEGVRGHVTPSPPFTDQRDQAPPPPALGVPGTPPPRKVKLFFAPNFFCVFKILSKKCPNWHFFWLILRAKFFGPMFWPKIGPPIHDTVQEGVPPPPGSEVEGGD